MFKVKIIFLISLKLCYCNLIYHYENGYHYPTTINYYPKILFNINYSKIHITNYEKSIIEQTNKHTDVCNNLLFNVLSSVAENLNDQDSQNYLDLQSSIFFMNKLYTKNFTEFIINNSNTSAKIITGDVKFSLNKIYSFVTEKSDDTLFNVDGLFNTILNIDKKNKEKKNCDVLMTIEQQLYNVYNCLSLTILNMYSMAFYKNSPSVEKKKILKRKLGLLAKESLPVIVKLPSQNLYKCDPKEFQEGINFIELKNFITTHVIGKDIMKNKNICDDSSSCSDYSKVLSPFVLNNSPHQCQGYLRNCWKVSINDICLSENQSNRRYQAFKNDDGQSIGSWTNKCQGNNIVSYEEISKNKKYFLTPSAGVFSANYEAEKCDICACYCDNEFNINSINKFSLQEVRAKHDQGVVTGIKFDIDGDTIVLKIRVGIFINGTVDANQQSWDSNYVSTFNPGTLPPYSLNSTDQQYSSHKNNHPYKTVRLDYNWRNMYLDNLVAPPGKLIQGVKFIECSDGISIGILATSINEENLQLIPDTAEWWSISNCFLASISKPRMALSIPNSADVPTKLKTPNNIVNKKNSYVTFEISDWQLDASQTIIPFIDAQPVITSPSVPLSGITIHYKTQDKSGGFIGLQIQPFNPSYFMDEDILSNNIDKLLNGKKIINDEE
ncbi:hypothetical protein HCN44_008186 [Aphidius gifuensis]|uniref:Venom protein n=1 Tax=Aphidius gifuensis TaxID=684658 RepID=A0A834XPZ3_APHGI|nr:hypothetical protein HCN44_008186 [Aphidius gifuensis]